MSGVLAHALGLAAMPTVHDAMQLLPQFSLHRELARADGGLAAPLLAVNGTDDLYVPIGDVAVFESFADATVWLVAGAGHCAFERFREVRDRAVSWIQGTVARRTATLP